MYSVNQVSDNQTDIEVVKGNTFRQQVKIKDQAGLCYIPEVADTILFRVYNKYTDETPLYQKEIDYRTLMLELTAKETSHMRYGNYVYKITLIRRAGDVDDFINGKFSVKGVI